MSLAFLLAASVAHAETNITYQMWGSPAEAEARAVVVDGFQTLHPDIKVTVELADWDSYWEQLRVQFAGGTPPDVSPWTHPCIWIGNRAAS